MLRLATFVALCFALCSAEAWADLSVGDSVTLVVRDNHVPGHPSDGDRHVSVRFQSGSTASVVEIGNWVKVSGQSTTGSGWIVKKYIVSQAAGPPEITFPELAWCLAKGSPDKHPSGRIRLATWNIATLHREIGGRIFHDSAAREPVDYERIRCYSRLLDADIIAVQEIDGIEALRRVIDTDVYDLHMSGRSAHQNTGFAFKKGLDVTTRPDFEALDVGRVRRGTRIDLSHNGKTIKLMSVHLKSGCFSNSSSGSACTKLQAQVPVLERWIDDAASGSDAFIVLGDFNRRLVQGGDLVWAELDDGVPPNANLVAATENMPISCRDNEFTQFIDHILLDQRAAQWLDSSSFRHVTYRQQDKDVWGLISDHCPVVVELWIE